jgi:hypothetical protein
LIQTTCHVLQLLVTHRWRESTFPSCRVMRVSRMLTLAFGLARKICVMGLSTNRHILPRMSFASICNSLD